MLAVRVLAVIICIAPKSRALERSECWKWMGTLRYAVSAASQLAMPVWSARHAADHGCSTGYWYWYLRLNVIVMCRLSVRQFV